MTNLYRWSGKANFGDELGPALLRFLNVEHTVLSEVADADLTLVGSVLEHLPARWSGTICGAAKLHENSHVDLSAARVLALRGKLTADSVKGLKGPIVLGDPGLLVPDFVEQPLAKYELGVLPHWSDHELAGRFSYGQILDVREPPEKVIQQIASCKRIVSSSLHGLIVADAYGIPRQAELFPNAATEGGDFKYRDYCSVYDTHPHFGEMWRAPHHIVERIRTQLRGAFAQAVDRTPPPKVVVTPPDVDQRDHGLPPRISLLVPFSRNSQDVEHRARTWKWLTQFWRAHLPMAEIVIGYDDGWVFSKSRAINRAAEQACGEVFVILDADAYMDPQVIIECAKNISAALAKGKHLWYVPYRRLYRLNEEFTVSLIDTDPGDPYALPTLTSADNDVLEPGQNVTVNTGYTFGAMVQMMPAEAFFACGGMDPRFQGWGGEDAAFLRAVDTLYAAHEVTNNDVTHLWHLRPGADWRTRRWVGQLVQQNARLAQRYSLATGEKSFMQSLVAEHAGYTDRLA